LKKGGGWIEYAAAESYSDSWKVSRIKLKCLTNLAFVSEKWHKSIWWAVNIFLKKIKNKNNKGKNGIKCKMI
jgi:hypothetical protein